MSTKAKNIIAQRILSTLLLVALLVTLPAFDNDATSLVVFGPMCIYLMFTKKEVFDMFRD